MDDLGRCADLAAARQVIVARARVGGLGAAVDMLTEALRQMEALGPSLSAEVWSGYAEIFATATMGRRSASRPEIEEAFSPRKD